MTNTWHFVLNHTIIRAAFVCLFVPLLLRGPLTDLRQTWWVYVGGPRNCPWGVLFWIGQRLNGSMGQTSLCRSRRQQAETTMLKVHGVFCRARRLLPSKMHMASKSLIVSMGIFTSNLKFHLFYATSACCHSNMSKSKVKYV